MKIANKHDRPERKAPNAPKRFRSSYIFFSQSKHKEIKGRLYLEGRENKVRYHSHVYQKGGSLILSCLFLNETYWTNLFCIV